MEASMVPLSLWLPILVSAIIVFAAWQDTIWFKRNWVATLKSNIDGLIYGLLTAGTFGWLWPR
jgi:hypothetical protein